jgi:parallel beta-helix repeat protein
MDNTYSNRVSNNTIEANGEHGMELNFADGTTVEANLVKANGGSGLASEYSDAISVHGNRVEDNDGLGIGLNRLSQGTVANNTVTGNVVGIDFGNSVGTVENNTVTAQSDDGIRVVLDPHVAVHRNNIQDNEGYGLFTNGVSITSDEPVDARHNWWGAANGPSGGVDDECTSETADGDGDEIWTFTSPDTVCFTPWLKAPNPDAGADLQP